MLFQFDIFDIIYILSVIILFLQVVGFIGLIIVGISQFRNKEGINKPIIFAIIGLIEVLYFSINERIIRIMWGIWGGSITDFILQMQDALRGLIPNIISLITFGALFLFLGIKNKENFGKFLMFSGIFWIVFGIFIITFDSILISTYTPPPIPIELYRFSLFLPSIASIFMITSSIFFMIYAIKVDVKILLFSSICLLLASIVFAGNSFFQLILFFP